MFWCLALLRNQINYCYQQSRQISARHLAESYAMENALEELKKIAKHIAPPNDEDGVMRVVKQRFGV